MTQGSSGGNCANTSQIPMSTSPGLSHSRLT